MTIVLTGGGSGGHITPLLVVASELKKQKPGVKLVYIGQKGDSLADVPAKDPNIDEVYSVRAGKFRRYNGEGLKQLVDVSTIIKNIRDVIFVLIGLIQSYFIIRKIKPDIVFSRGSYVSVPVCLGAKLNGVGYITHDSDPIPSLTNRIISRWARLHFLAASKDIYPYPQNKTITTGIPVNKSFVRVVPEVRAEYKQKLNINQKDKVLFVIGGGLGAQSLNEAVCEILPNLLSEFKDLKVIHVAGRNNENQVIEAYDQNLSADYRSRVEVIAFTNEVYLYSGASDVVITRAGATNLAEFEIQGAVCIIVPSTYLVAGHQLKNAQLLKDKDAAIVIRDTQLAENPHTLAKEVSLLLKDSKKRQKLSESILEFAHPNAGEKIAALITQSIEAN